MSKEKCWLSRGGRGGTGWSGSGAVVDNSDVVYEEVCVNIVAAAAATKLNHFQLLSCALACRGHKLGPAAGEGRGVLRAHGDPVGPVAHKSGHRKNLGLLRAAPAIEFHLHRA